MTQFPRRVYRKVEEAGHFSRRCPPTLGIPGRPEDAGVKAPASWCESGRWVTNLHQPGPCLGFTEIPTRAPPHDLPRPPGVVAPELSATWGGQAGEGLGMPPRPRVNRRFRTFFARPASFLLLPSWRRVPARPPLPAPRQAEPSPPQEVGAERRPR